MIVAGCLLAAVSVHAFADSDRSVASITVSDGLAGETVHDVMTDHNGHVWLATSSGVSVYDGKHIDNLRISDKRGRQLKVLALCEVAGRVVYAATEGGLYRMFQGEGTFERFLPEVISPETLLAVGDTLYIGSQQGLQYYDGTRLHHTDVSVSRKGIDNVVRQYAVGDDGLIWFLGRYDLNSFHPATGKIVHYSVLSADNAFALSRFAPLGRGRFVIGSRTAGLYVYDIQSRQLQHVEGVGNIVSTVQRAADGSICVATDGAGAYRLQVRGEHLEVAEHFAAEADGQHRIPSNGIYCYYRDANGVNWLGMVRYGLAYTYHNSGLFSLLEVKGFSTDGINVRTFCRHQQHVVIGTQSGFYYINVATGLWRYFSPAELGGGHIVNTVTWHEGRFYIGTFDGGLRVFDAQTLRVAKQTFTPDLDNGSIGDLKTGPDGRLWIGSSHGLTIVGEGRVQQHFTEQNSHIIGGLILSITFDRSGNAWLTGRSGCSVYSARSHEVAEANFPSGFFNLEPWMRGATGHDGLVFMRSGPQTFYTNEQMTDFGELQLPITLHDKWCRNFIDDMDGHYLLSSERGVLCFDYELHRMQCFSHGEGLRGSFINDMRIGQDRQLWVATSQGLFYTDKQRLRAWQQQASHKVQFARVRQGSDLIALNRRYEFNASRRLSIGWNLTSDVLQLTPVLMDYARQTGRVYEYRLDGADWQMVDSQHLIYLSGLGLGEHNLQLQLAGAEGTLSTFVITVIPTGWAIAELVLLLVAVVLLWLWWRFRKNTKVLIAERNDIEDALVASESESEALRKELEDISLTADPSPLASEKYQRVKIDETECADIVGRMKAYIERERVYTNQELKMKDLADVLHLSAPKLSQVFNVYMGQNYYDFINNYRLEEFKRLIAAGEYKRYTITALSEQCGFKKSNFFSTFRKVEGMTPAEYLKKQGIKLG